jgi:hypothetical protein
MQNLLVFDEVSFIHFKVDNAEQNILFLEYQSMLSLAKLNDVVLLVAVTAEYLSILNAKVG